MDDTKSSLAVNETLVRPPSKWFKYLVEDRSSTLHTALRDHSLELSGSTHLTLPRQKVEFYDLYLKDFQFGRINQYFEFLINRIPPNSKVLPNVRLFL